jgi:hypothetical protein
VYLVFVNENVRAEYAETIRDSAPADGRLNPRGVRRAELVRVITAETEQELPELLCERLAEVRVSE